MNNTGRKEQYITHSRLNHRHRQSTEVFGCHKKTVTRKTSLQRRRRRLSGKHCLKLRFPAENENPWPSLPRLRSVVVMRLVVDA